MQDDLVLRRNLRLCTWEGLFATPLVFLSLPGNFLFAYLLTEIYKLDKGSYGLIVSLPAWFNALQLFITPVLTRFFPVRTTMLCLTWTNIGIWASLIVALPFIPQDNPAQASSVFLLIIGLLSCLASVSGVAWTSWIQGWVPKRVRGKYFGVRNRVMGLATIVFLLLAGELLDGAQNVVRIFQVLFVIALLLRILSVILIQQISSPPEDVSARLKRNIFADWSLLRKTPSFLAFVTYGAVTGFALNFAGPFGAPYMYDYLGVPVERAQFIFILGSLTGAFAHANWGRLIDRYGCKPVMAVTLTCWQAMDYAWTFITPSMNGFLYVMFAWGGIMSAGFTMGMFTLLMKLLNIETRTSGVSFNLALVSFSTAIAPVLAGYLLEQSPVMGVDQVWAYRFVFFFKSTVCILSLLLLKRVIEPDSAPVGVLLGSMRSWRQILSVTGMTQFANQNVILKSRKKKKIVPLDGPPDNPNSKD